MGKRMSFEKLVASMSATERLQHAKLIVSNLTDRILEVLELEAANEIIVYSDTLSKQVPRSYAAHSFNGFQRAMMNYEIIRILAIWDAPAENAISIPTVICLLDHQDIHTLLADDLYRHHASTNIIHVGDERPSDDMNALLKAGQENFANNAKTDLLTNLPMLIGDANTAIKSDLLKVTKNTRDHLAHSLSQTHLEQREAVIKMKFGDEKKLIESAVDIIHKLHVYVNGSDFDISGDCRRRYARNASALWTACVFNIVS